jgi:hypothetical protein
MNASRAITLLAAVLLTGTSTFAAAHDEAFFDSRESAHGGQTRMAGPYHLELVAKNNEIVLYVMDHADRALSTAGGGGKATVQIAKSKGNGKDKTSVKLEAAGDNMLKGTGGIGVSPKTVVTVFVDLPGQEVTTARFTPFKPVARTAGKENAAIPPANSKDAHSHHHM